LRIVKGPQKTLAVGFESGSIGLWSLDDGSRLYHKRLHGPVVYLRIEKQRWLYAATELGQYLTLDLGILTEDYCQLMQKIWWEMPLVWGKGGPLLQRPPADHRCAAK
jgi:hypothetical protein